MNVDKYVKPFDNLDYSQKEEILAELVCVIRDLVVEMSSKVNSVEDNGKALTENIIEIMKEQHLTYLAVIDQLKSKYPLIDNLNKNAFFDFMKHLGGTFEDMVDLYYAHCSIGIIDDMKVN